IGELAGKGADLLINISASPFTVEKFGQRLAILRRIARKRGMPIVYANLVGGNDNLIFDGRSMIMNGKGELAGLCRPFEEDLAVFETSGRDFSGTAISMESTMDDTAEIASALSLGLKDYVKKTGFEKVLIGLSGGIDSAVTAAIAAAALGPRNVISVMMPSRYSSVMSVRDSLKIAENLGVRHFAIPIDPIFDAFRDSLAPILGGDDEGVVFENVQARIRGVLLMALSNRLGALVINTGNKSELAAGYCTLYGDMIGGIGVLADLTKENVYALARHFNREREIIPETAITRPPSAELRPDQKDEDTIPPYPVLDNIVKLYIEDQADLDGIEARGYDRETAAKIIKMIMTSEYKRRQAPMGLKITAKAFGTGRRIPIAHR
ncbi:MAG: NAD+ synthase, partial [Deltaproteobacteria bacterium]|nr:NAD+ synthase [Deltaproteobacteria bacterium]